MEIPEYGHDERVLWTQGACSAVGGVSGWYCGVLAGSGWSDVLVEDVWHKSDGEEDTAVEWRGPPVFWLRSNSVTPLLLLFWTVCSAWWCNLTISFAIVGLSTISNACPDFQKINGCKMIQLCVWWQTQSRIYLWDVDVWVCYDKVETRNVTDKQTRNAIYAALLLQSLDIVIRQNCHDKNGNVVIVRNCYGFRQSTNDRHNDRILNIVTVCNPH